MTLRRSLLAAAVGCIALTTLWAPAALAQSRQAGGRGDAFVVLTGKLDVASDESVDDAVIFDGDATIDGTARGNVVAFNGDVVVTGSVGGDVVALNGRVTLADGANVGGNVVSSQTPNVGPGAVVGGEVRHESYRFNAGDLAVVGRIAFWIAASVSSFLLGLLLVFAWPRASDAIAAAAKGSVGGSIGWGALMFFGLPIVGGILVATIVASLLGLGVLLALVLIYSLGYAAGAFAFGRLLLKPPTHRFLAFLLGWGILRLVALIPILGGLLFMAATIPGTRRDRGCGLPGLAEYDAGRARAGAGRHPDAPDAQRAVTPRPIEAHPGRQLHREVDARWATPRATRSAARSTRPSTSCRPAGPATSSSRWPPSTGR